VVPDDVILVDSDILIAHLRGLEAAGDWLVEARGQGPLAISVVSITEIAGGMRSGALLASLWPPRWGESVAR